MNAELTSLHIWCAIWIAKGIPWKSFSMKVWNQALCVTWCWCNIFVLIVTPQKTRGIYATTLWICYLYNIYKLYSYVATWKILPCRSFTSCAAIPDCNDPVVCDAHYSFRLWPMDCWKFPENITVGYLCLGRWLWWWSSSKWLAWIQAVGPREQVAVIQLWL